LAQSQLAAPYIGQPALRHTPRCTSFSPSASTPFRFPISPDSARNGFESARLCTFVTAHAYSHINKIKMQNNQIHQYHGYAVQPSAHRLPDGSFSSNLLLERTDRAQADGCYQFYSLDYFASEEQALQHSARWAHNWVDTRG
jgi:hypothetical protein